MSEQANLQVIKDVYEAFSSGDIQKVIDALSDDVEWDTPGPVEIPFAGLFRGKAGVADFFRLLADSDDLEFFEAETFFAKGDRVVTLGHYSARVKATGKLAQADWVHSFVLHDGKIAKYRIYYDTAKYAEAYPKVAAKA